MENLLFDVHLHQDNPCWRSWLAKSADYIEFCGIVLTAAAIADSQRLSAMPNESNNERISFNERIIDKAEQFATLYARITASTIEEVGTHYANRDAFLAYTISNWPLFFAMGKGIVLK